MNTQEQEETQKRKEEEYDEFVDKRRQIHDKLKNGKLKIKIYNILSSVNGIKIHFIRDMFIILKKKYKNNENIIDFIDNLINNINTSLLSNERSPSSLHSILYNFYDENVLIDILYCIDDNKSYENIENNIYPWYLITYDPE